jgi:hypothetical protein
VSGSLASAVGALVQARNLVTAGVLAAFLALALRAAGLLFLDRGRGALVAAGRALAATAFLGLGGLYLLFTAHQLELDAPTLLVAAAVLLVLLSSLFWRRRRGAGAGRAFLVPLLVQLCLLLALLLLAAVTLMQAGFLALTRDRPVLLVDVTGETRMQMVAWAPPDRPPREEPLSCHYVIFRTPEGTEVAQAWVYGDEVAVKGRVLRLSPLLNAAGVSNLFELQFAHNGYFTAERHNEYPHQATRLPSVGPLAVHPWWRGVQARLLERWERGTVDGSEWAIRSATTESTYFPLVDAEGRPRRGTYRLVLTPGGLTAG